MLPQEPVTPARRTDLVLPHMSGLQWVLLLCQPSVLTERAVSRVCMLGFQLRLGLYLWRVRGWRALVGMDV